METLTNIHLHPVIYLSPFIFDEVIYPFKTKVNEDRVYQYWKEILVKNGLSNLEPIKRGLHYVKTDDIDDQSLKTLIEYFLIDISEYRCSVEPNKGNKGNKEKTDEITPTSFEGGVIFTSNDKIIMTPQCCVSLQDHKEWSRIHRSEKFERIWLGHPWIYYRIKGDNIFFTRLIEKAFDGKTWKHYTTLDNTMMMDSSQCIEKSEKVIDDEDLKYIVNYQEMKRAISDLQNELKAFQNRVEIIVRKMQLVKPEKVASCFVNGNGEMLSYNEMDME